MGEPRNAVMSVKPWHFGEKRTNRSDRIHCTDNKAKLATDSIALVKEILIPFYFNCLVFDILEMRTHFPNIMGARTRTENGIVNIN